MTTVLERLDHAAVARSCALFTAAGFTGIDYCKGARFSPRPGLGADRGIPNDHGRICQIPADRLPKNTDADDPVYPVGCSADGVQTEQRGLVLSPVGVMAAVFNLNHPAHTVDWEFIHLSVANVVVIGLMFVVFFLAILLPFPGSARRRGGSS
jgi:hypothetical protein